MESIHPSTSPTAEMLESSKEWNPHVGREAKKALAIAVPMIVTNLIYFAIMVSGLMFVGHLGVLELSGAALGNSLGSVTGLSVMMGLASGLETLCGQAYGAKQYHMLGVYLQTAVLVLLCCSIPLSLLWWNMEPVLLFIGQEAQIAMMTGKYMRALVPGLWAAAITQPTIKYLQTQSVVFPVMLCSLVTFIVHVPLCYLLVYKVGGFLGGAWAISISYWLILLELIAYIVYSDSRRSEKTWTGFVWPKFRMIWLYFRLAVTSAFMIIVQFWAFELLVLLAGLLPNPEKEVSLLSICLNTAGVAFTLPFGLSAAASTRVSNELGRGNTNGAKLAMKVVTGISMLQAIVIGVIMVALRKKWGLAFSNEPEVVKDAADILPFLAFATFLDGIQGVLGGVLRGCGLQDPASIINILAFYGVGVPLAILFGFHFKWGSKGLYGGCICGSITQFLLIVLLVALINWDKQVDKARERVTGVQNVRELSPDDDSGGIHEALLKA